MMTRISTRKATGSKLVPVALLVSLALAVGVWLVPMPFLRTEKQAVEVVTPQASGVGDSSDVRVRVEPHDWLAIEAALSSARTPPPTDESDEPEGETNRGDEGEEGDAQDDQATAHLPPLSWRYVGWIAQPNGRVAAVMNIDGATRIFYAGATIRDTVDPQQRDVTISRITRDAVTLRRAGKRESIPIERVNEPTNDVPSEADPIQRSPVDRR